MYHETWSRDLCQETPSFSVGYYIRGWDEDSNYSWWVADDFSNQQAIQKAIDMGYMLQLSQSHIAFNPFLQDNSPLQNHSLVSQKPQQSAKKLELIGSVVCSSTIPSSIKDEQCVICKEKLGYKAQKMVILQCTHKFHVRCIRRWLNRNSRCPCCRASFQ